MRPLNAYGPSFVVLVTAVLVLVMGPRAVQSLTFEQTRVQMLEASHRLEDNDVLARLNQGFIDIGIMVEPSVVHINTRQAPDVVPRRVAMSSGSGWIYDDDGHIVTNYHVVRDADNIEVQLATGELRRAELVGFDEFTDIAVIEVPPGNLHPALRVAGSHAVEQGEIVFAFGSPFDFRRSMSQGIVSGTGRSVDVLGPRGYENFIQVDAAINPGNSGGPLADHTGRVIGMNTAIATGRRSSLEEGQFAGIGLAIPMSMIEPVVDQLIRNGGVVEKGLLGLVPWPLDVLDAQERFGFVGSGVAVRSVTAGLPASDAGVRARDIITHINGEQVESPSQLRSIIASKLPGDTVELTVFRADEDTRRGDTMRIAVTLDRLDLLRDSGVLPANQPEDRVPQLGLQRIATATPENTAEADVDFQAGVLIQETVPDTYLARRVPAGAIIVEVEGIPVTDVPELYAVLRRTNLRDGARISLVLPGGEVQSFRLRVPR